MAADRYCRKKEAKMAHDAANITVYITVSSHAVIVSVS